MGPDRLQNQDFRARMKAGLLVFNHHFQAGVMHF